MKRKRTTDPKETKWFRSPFASAVWIPIFGSEDRARREAKMNEEGEGCTFSRACVVCEESVKFTCIHDPETGEMCPTAGISVVDYYVNYTVTGKWVTDSPDGQEVAVCIDCAHHLHPNMPRCLKCNRMMLDKPYLGQCRACMPEKSIGKLLLEANALSKAQKLYYDATGEDVVYIPYRCWAEKDLDGAWKTLRDLLLESVKKILH